MCGLQMTDQWMIMFLGRIDVRDLIEKISKQFVIDMNSYKSSQMIVHFCVNCQLFLNRSLCEVTF